MKQNDITDIDVAQLPSQSFENLFNVETTEDGLYYYNILKTVNFPTDLNPLYYVLYSTRPKDTWPLISWKFYQNVKLWWLLCSLNQVHDPITKIEPGNVIRILKVELVRQVLDEIRNQ